MKQTETNDQELMVLLFGTLLYHNWKLSKKQSISFFNQNPLLCVSIFRRKASCQKKQRLQQIILRKLLKKNSDLTRKLYLVLPEHYLLPLLDNPS